MEGIQRVLIFTLYWYISNLLNKDVAYSEKILRGINQEANDEIFDSTNSPVFTGIDLISTYIYLNIVYVFTFEISIPKIADNALTFK